MWELTVVPGILLLGRARSPSGPRSLGVRGRGGAGSRGGYKRDNETGTSIKFPHKKQPISFF